jgi:uncharacterized protein
LKYLAYARINRLQVIFKTVEICNLKCDYCYYYQTGDDSWKNRPTRVASDTVVQLADFLKQGIQECHIETLQIVFHGGEPTLQRPEDFDWACNYLTVSLGSLCRLEFTIQTNGTRLDKKWLELFVKHRVAVGVSIDGRKAIHDKARPYHNGRGSYDRTVAGIQLLQSNEEFNADKNLGALSVLDAELDYRDVINHLHCELGINDLGFLLPDCTHDDGIPNLKSGLDYGRALVDIFDVWAEHAKLNVREVEVLLRKFQKTKLSPSGIAYSQANKDFEGFDLLNHIIVVQSDGELNIDDSYMPVVGWRQSVPRASIFDVSLEDHLRFPVFTEIYGALSDMPDLCKECVWVGVCKAGDALENRWSTEKKFNNPSVFCEALKIYYEHVVKWLYKQGYPKDEIASSLGLTYTVAIVI